MIKSEKGQATVELALTITLLVFILFGIIDFGRIFHAYLTLEHAGREGARMASVGGTDAEIVLRVKESAPSLHSSNLIVSTSPTQQSRTRGTYATVNVSYSISFTIPLFKNILPDPLVLKGKTVMRVE